MKTRIFFEYIFLFSLLISNCYLSPINLNFNSYLLNFILATIFYQIILNLANVHVSLEFFKNIYNSNKINSSNLSNLIYKKKYIFFLYSLIFISLESLICIFNFKTYGILFEKYLPSQEIWSMIFNISFIILIIFSNSLIINLVLLKSKKVSNIFFFISFPIIYATIQSLDSSVKYNSASLSEIMNSIYIVTFFLFICFIIYGQLGESDTYFSIIISIASNIIIYSAVYNYINNTLFSNLPFGIFICIVLNFILSFLSNKKLLIECITFITMGAIVFGFDISHFSLRSFLEYLILIIIYYDMKLFNKYIHNFFNEFTKTEESVIILYASSYFPLITLFKVIVVNLFKFDDNLSEELYNLLKRSRIFRDVELSYNSNDKIEFFNQLNQLYLSEKKYENSLKYKLILKDSYTKIKKIEDLHKVKIFDNQDKKVTTIKDLKGKIEKVNNKEKIKEIIKKIESTSNEVPNKTIKIDDYLSNNNNDDSLSKQNTNDDSLSSNKKTDDHLSSKHSESHHQVDNDV